MRYSWLSLALAILTICTFLIGCNGGRYSNPSSPPASSTAWRTVTVTNAGGTYDFSDIGLYIIVPPEAVPVGESYTYDVRGFPPGVPLLPSGPVLVRLGTFQFYGVGATFDRPIEVRFRIVEEKPVGLSSLGYRLNDDLKWEFSQRAPVLSDGLHTVMHIDHPGVYGSFEYVNLHVEATVSQQMGPVPLSVGFKAIITGGHPPYGVVWNFGDNTDPMGGVSVAHAYLDPGDYTVTVMVSDAYNYWTSDWIHLTAYWVASPPALP